MKPYFHRRAEVANTKHGTFEADDEVRILPCGPNFPAREGVILFLVHGNHGKGRIYARVKLENSHEINVPIGSCRHKKVKV